MQEFGSFLHNQKENFPAKSLKTFKVFGELPEKQFQIPVSITH
jgi:hypothetical protein